MLISSHFLDALSESRKILGIQPVGLIAWKKAQVDRMAATLALSTNPELEIAFAYRLEGEIKLDTGEWKTRMNPIKAVAEKFYASNSASILTVAVYMQYFDKDNADRLGENSLFWQAMAASGRSRAATKRRGTFLSDVNAVVKWAWDTEAGHPGRLHLIFVPILEDKVTKNETFRLIEMTIEGQVEKKLAEMVEQEPADGVARVRRFLGGLGLRRSTIGTAVHTKDVVIYSDLKGALPQHEFAVKVGPTTVKRKIRWMLETNSRLTSAPRTGVYDDLGDAAASGRGVFCNDGSLVWAEGIDSRSDYYTDGLVEDNAAYRRELSAWKTEVAAKL